MTDELTCRFCDRPCANGTGRAAHERHCSSRASAAVCKACHQDYPRGGLNEHLKTCPASATAELGRAPLIEHVLRKLGAA